jgi:hypothetical protein
MSTRAATLLNLPSAVAHGTDRERKPRITYGWVDRWYPVLLPASLLLNAAVCYVIVRIIT